MTFRSRRSSPTGSGKFPHARRPHPARRDQAHRARCEIQRRLRRTSLRAAGARRFLRAGLLQALGVRRELWASPTAGSSFGVGDEVEVILETEFTGPPLAAESALKAAQVSADSYGVIPDAGLESAPSKFTSLGLCLSAKPDFIKAQPSTALDFIPADTEAGRLARSIDWAATPLGESRRLEPGAAHDGAVRAREPLSAAAVVGT